MNRILFVLLYVLLSALIASMPIYYGLNIALEIGIPVFVIGIEQIFNQLQLYVSLFFARKRLVISVVATFTFAMSLLVIASTVDFDKQIELSAIVPMIQFAMQGGVVGVILRQLLLSISLNNLFNRSYEIQRLLFLGGINIFLWLFPVVTGHGAFSGFYLLGFAGGLLAHFMWRRILLNRMRLSRYGRSVFEMIAGDKSQLSEVEKQAFLLFIHGKSRKLERLFQRLEKSSMSPRLRILQACLLRTEGKYVEALHTVENALLAQERMPEFDHLLFLQRGLAHGELDENRRMYDALQQSDKMEPNNFLPKMTLALRLAEEIPLDAIGPSRESRRALRLMALALYNNASKPKSELLSELVGRSLPFRWGLVQDAYGYALLKSGDFAFSKDLFLSCIEKEPSFSASYLHLGEWYIAYYLHRKPEKRALQLAHRCLSIAIKLEKSPNSRIARRANQFLRKYLSTGPEMDDSTR